MKATRAYLTGPTPVREAHTNPHAAERFFSASWQAPADPSSTRVGGGSRLKGSPAEVPAPVETNYDDSEAAVTQVQWVQIAPIYQMQWLLQLGAEPVDESPGTPEVAGFLAAVSIHRPA